MTAHRTAPPREVRCATCPAIARKPRARAIHNPLQQTCVSSTRWRSSGVRAALAACQQARHSSSAPTHPRAHGLLAADAADACVATAAGADRRSWREAQREGKTIHVPLEQATPHRDGRHLRNRCAYLLSACPLRDDGPRGELKRSCHWQADCSTGRRRRSDCRGVGSC
jgi:hypothetical protein